jgi:polar amino acid transport system substrate-binding protein/cystine transport system substrate-binding protein/membrane-bound lytic murein transglycosylase F
MLNAGLFRDLARALPIVALLAAVYLLPPDTSLAVARQQGTLRACMPPVAPPFVTGNAAMPGIDPEILRSLAGALGLGFAIEAVPAMAQDFNPRSWHLTRAACELVAGGLAASTTTRSFLDTTPPYAETGWAIVAPNPVTDLHGLRLGVFAPPSGLDRIALASELRAQAAQVQLAPDAEALAAGLAAGRFDAAVTERRAAERIAARGHWSIDWLPGKLPRTAIAFGLWKGDLTLKRAMVAELERLQRDGKVAEILARY